MEKILIQSLLLLATLALVLYFVANRRKARAKAGVKIGFVLFVVVCVLSVVFPQELTVAANFLGVDRGSDLLLYGLVMAFMFTTVSSYIRFREQELHYARLARAVALQSPVRPEDDF